MYSSPRPGTPYVVFSPKPAGDNYFDGHTRQAASPLQCSTRDAKHARPATPFGSTKVACGDDAVEITGASEKYGVGLGLGMAPDVRGTRGVSGQHSRSSSGNLSSRRPSLRILRMPSVDVGERALPSGRTHSSSGSSNRESEATLVACRTLSTSTVAGPGQARFELDEDIDSSEEGDTPRVKTFATALRNSQRKATPYPCDRVAYFEEEEEEMEEESISGMASSPSGAIDGDDLSVHA